LNGLFVQCMPNHTQKEILYTYSVISSRLSSTDPQYGGNMFL
jgi:hypothetical protein